MSDYLYGTSNYTGPYISNGHYQASVEFGSVKPSSKLDAVSRLHDSAYAKWSDRIHKAAADEIFSYQAKRMGSIPAKLSSFLVDNFNALANLGSNPDYDSVNYLAVLTEVLDYYDTDPFRSNPDYQPFEISYGTQVVRKAVGDYLSKIKMSEPYIPVLDATKPKPNVVNMNIPSLGPTVSKLPSKPVTLLDEGGSYSGNTPVKPVVAPVQSVTNKLTVSNTPTTAEKIQTNIATYSGMDSGSSQLNSNPNFASSINSNMNAQQIKDLNYRFPDNKVRMPWLRKKRKNKNKIYIC